MEQAPDVREQYFAVLDPERRKELLDAYAETDPADAALLEELWTLRYTDPKNPRQRVDTYLWQIVNLITLARMARFISGGTAREIKAAMKTLGFATADHYGEAGRKTLYLEFRNAAQRYFSTCDSKSYGRKLMGLMSANDDERATKTAREVWQLTEGLPGRFETDQDMALFCKAVRDEYVAEYSDGEERLAAQGKKRGGRGVKTVRDEPSSSQATHDGES